jgi:hypothetical protein
MFFTNNALTKWQSEGLWGEADDTHKAKMRAKVDRELTKLGIGK